MSDQRTFSESWYRIAEEHVCLRPHVKARLQYFRGEKWYMLYDPFSNQFFRLRPAAYDFVARLTLNRTVEETWKEALAHNPDEAPGQEDVLQILSQLHQTNLLQYRTSGDVSQLFERYRKRRQNEVTSKFLNIMFSRFPLWDPDEFLKRTALISKYVFGPLGALIWLVVVGLASKLAVENAHVLWDQRQGVLAPGNLALLYIAFAFTKALHELGHGYVCRKYGGEVHTMGIMLLVFTPVPFVDATSAWSFRSKWQRIYVGAAGMIVELFVAAIAVFAWANTGPGLIHSLAYNVMFTASVSTLLFNANPLLRYDGYYMLADGLDVPNLSPRSNMQLSYFFEKYLYGYAKALSPANGRWEGCALWLYGILSLVYRVYISFRIILFVMNQYLLIGIIMAATCIISWGIVPLGKLLRYVGSSPKLERTRWRAISVTAALTSLLVVGLGLMPFPDHFNAPGILRATRFAQVAPEEPGYVARLLVPTGTRVAKGQPLLVLKNRELEIEWEMTMARYRQARALERQAREHGAPELRAILAHLKSVKDSLGRLQTRRNAMTVRAEVSGKWVAPDAERLQGTWLQRGQPAGYLVDDSSFEFIGIVVQAEVSRLFEQDIAEGRIRLSGQAGQEMIAASVEVIPGEQTRLPSSALGYQGGGNIAVDLTDASGTRAAEPFFEVKAKLPQNVDALLLHGRTGEIRFDLPPQPLARQWFRKLRQIFQRKALAKQA